MSRTTILEGVFLTFFASLALLFFLRPVWDIDVFWHIAAGRWMVTHGELPTTDILGVDSDRTWIPIQWAYQVLVYKLDRWGGMPLIRGVHAVAMLTAFGLLYRVYRKQLQSVVPAMLLWLFTLLLFGDRINVRPHVFNLLALALLLPTLLGGWRTASRAHIITLAVLFFVWANLHAGGCFLMLIVTASIPIGAALEKDRPHLKKGLLVFGVCATACILSPLFVRGMIYTFSLLRATEAGIGEWHAPIAYFFVLPDPTWSQLVAGATPYVTLLTLGVLVLRGHMKDVDPVLLGVALALTGLSLIYVRFVHLTAPVWLIVMYWLSPNWSLPRLRWSALGAAALIFFLVWQARVVRPYGNISEALAAAKTDIETHRFPVEAGDFLTSAGFEGSVFCNAGCGSYLLWRLHPQIRAIIDGRFNVPPKTQTELIYVSNMHGRQGEPDVMARMESIYNRHALDALVLPTPGFGSRGPDCSQWLPVYLSRRLEVYFRNDSENSENLKRVGLKAGMDCRQLFMGRQGSQPPLPR